MSGEPVIPRALLRRLSGDLSEGVSSGVALHRLGFARLALAELRRAVHETPEDQAGWVDLLNYFLAEHLPLSALKILRELDMRGLSPVRVDSVRKELARFVVVPPITLYIPAFNAADSLGGVVDSVRAQSLQATQIIVVDDGSTDATAAVAARFPEVELIRHDLNRGLAAARNTAIAAAHHPLIASLDSDVLAGEFWLERLVTAMLESPLVGAFGALVERNAVRLADRWRARTMPLLYPGQGDVEDAVLFGSNTLFTRTALQVVDGYDPQYMKAFDDTDLGNRLRRAGLHIRYVHRAVCEHTRRDSLQSVLRSCYSYRKARALKERLFDQIETLELRWNTLFRDGIAEIEELRQTEATSVAFPTLLNIFWTIAEDLKEFLRVNDALPRRRYAKAVGIALNRASAEIPGLSGVGVAAIHSMLSPVLASVPMGEVNLGVEDPFVEEIYQRAFAKTGVVLHFSTTLCGAFERGAAESLSDEQRGAGTGQKLALVECGYLLGDHSTGGASDGFDEEIVARCRIREIDLAVFRKGFALRDPRQRATALKGYQPKQVILDATGESAERIVRSYLRLQDWCVGNTGVTIAGTTTSIDELLAADITADEPRRAVEKILGECAPNGGALA